MKEINDIITAYNDLDLSKNKVALATVIYVEGSSYRRAGARMLVQDNGIWIGGISGGCLEGDALKKANHCIARNKVEVVRYDTSKEDEEQIGAGLGCNGIIDVLLSPIIQEDSNNPIHILESCVNDRKANCLVTIINSDLDGLSAGEMYKYNTESKFPEQLTADINAALISGRSSVKTYDNLSVFIEILLPSLNVVLFGSSYDIYPLLKIGHELGWHMSVVTNPAKASRKMQLLSDTIYPKDATIPYDDFTAFVLMAHDYKTDKDNLVMALQTNVPYVGMLGPLKRKNKAINELKDNGQTFTTEQLNRLYNPIGLDIGSSTPEEIALAILAEIRAHFLVEMVGFYVKKLGLFMREVKSWKLEVGS